MRLRHWLAAVVALLLGLLLGLALSAATGNAAPRDPWGWLSANNMQLTAIGALATGAGFVAAAVAAGFAYVQARTAAQQAQLAAEALEAQKRALEQQVSTSGWESSRDCLWHFADRWTKLVENDVWSKAEHALHRTTDEDDNVIEVLSLLESMAFMGNRGHLDDELVWNSYYESVKQFWDISRGYIDADRLRNKDDLTLWQEYECWFRRLEKLDQAERDKAQVRTHMTPEERCADLIRAASARPSGTFRWRSGASSDS